MSNGIYEPKDGNNPFIKNIDEYKNLYEQSINNPSKFFSNLAKEDLSWIKDFTSVHNAVSYTHLTLPTTPYV